MVSRKIDPARQVHPVLRIALRLLMMALSASPTLATQAICDRDGNCVDHSGQPAPYFGTDPQHPHSSDGTNGIIFSLYDQEPYRNSDMGPLGVVLSTGEFQITVTDFEIPGRGIPFRLSRTYRSRRDGERSLLGHNWHLGYDEYLTPGFWSDAGMICEAAEWRMDNGWKDIWIDQCRLGMGWKAFVGFFGRIRPLPGRTGYQIRSADGTVKTFAQESRDANNHVIWLLTRIENRQGDALTIHHSGRSIDRITDTLGRSMSFLYDTSGRLIRVTDFAGRSVVYAYDAQGDLTTVRSPVVTGTPNGNDFPAGKTTTYRYLGANGCTEPLLRHNLQSITDAKGSTFLTNFYTSDADPLCGSPRTESGAPVDTVARQAYGGGVSPPMLLYSYGPGPGSAAPDANVVTTEATVTDRNGNVQVHRFNLQGNPISIETRTNRDVRSGEIDYLETNTYVIDSRGEQPMLVSRHTQSRGNNVDSAGNLVSYSEGMTEELIYYDQQGFAANPDLFQKGNVLQVIRTPGARGAAAGQERIETRYEYEPLFNQPIRITDPRGHVTKLTYDYQEGTYAQLTGGAAPDSVDPSWWVNATIAQFMATGNGNAQLGDLNGDGYHRAGNLIKVSEGAATNYAGSPVSPGPEDEIASYTAYNDFGLPTRTRDSEYNETAYRYFAENDPDGDLSLTPGPADGRSLSSVAGEAGGGYLKERVLDATATLRLPPGVGPLPRQGGQNPPPQNVLLSFTYDPVGNVRTARDGRGVRTDYSVNALNQIVQITHAATVSSEAPAAPAFSYLEQFRYDANNNVIQHRTERRDDGSFSSPLPTRWITKNSTYDALDRKISETLSTDDVPAISVTTSYAYDGNGNLRKTIFPAGNAILRFYDERDLLYREVVLKNASRDPEDMTYSVAFDSVTQYDYDGAGSVIQVTDPEGHVARSGYDGYGRKAVGFDSAFQKRTLSYDAGGNVLETVAYGTLGGPTPAPSAPPGSDYPEISRERHYYDELGRLRRSDSRSFKYVGPTLTPLSTDSNAGLATAGPGEPLPSAGDGWVTRLVGFDRLGRVVRSIDDNGHATEMRYDGLGRKIKIVMNVASPFTFDPTNPLNNRNATDTVYDPNGNVLQITETEYGADRTGASPRLLPAQQHRSTFKYDSMNRPIEARLVGRVGAPALNLTTTTVYDSRGNKVQVTDPAGGRSKSTYDGLNRLTKVEAGFFWNGATESVPANLINSANPDGRITTTYGYDLNNRLTSIQDDNNRVTSFLYDNLGRQIRITYPDGTYRETTYNRDSLATAWTHFSGTGPFLSIASQFDGLHRATRRDVHNSQAPSVVGTQRQSFEYDGLGRVTLAQDDASTSDGFVDSEVALSYDSLGKVLSEAQTWRDSSSGALLTGTQTVTSVYDGVGFRRTVAYPNDRTLSFLPDELNRPVSLVDSATGTVRYDYLGVGRLLSRIYPNGTKLTMLNGPADTLGAGYDAARRPIDFANQLNSTGANLARFGYGYDPAGNRAFERRLHEPSGSNWKGETFGYDAVYRLISRKEGILNAAGALQGSAGTSQDFTLDGLGNWKSHKKNTATYNQTLNSVNQYTLFNGPQGARTLNYDFLGNLINEASSLGDQQYSYDFLNRLVMVLDTGGNLATYRYDALGRRISKSLNGQTRTRYVYDGDRLIQERDGASTGQLVASYVYGLGSDEVLTRRRWQGGVASDLFYHTNALGSVAAVTSSTGAVVERYQYDAYGQVTFLSPTLTPLTSSAVYNNLLFTGRYFDPETRLYDYRARTYHPYLGRFLQRDPLGEAASLNLYNYVFNNPINATDPTGMISEAEAAQFMSDVKGQGGGGHGSQNWLRDMGSHSANMPQQGRDLMGEFRDGIAAMDKAHWEKRAADRQAERDQELKNQIQTSLADSAKVHNANGITTPVGVAVIVYGHNQTIGDKKNKTDLDQRAADLRQSGYVVIEVQADTLAKVGNASEPSSSGIGILEQAVAGVVANGPSGMPIEITGFSRGAGGAVQLTNALTDSGISGSRISVDLVDPYMGANSNIIRDMSVSVRVERSMGFHFVNALVINPGATLMGLDNKTLTQGTGAGRQIVNPTLFNLPHTRMDSCISARGALTGC